MLWNDRLCITELNHRVFRTRLKKLNIEIRRFYLALKSQCLDITCPILYNLQHYYTPEMVVPQWVLTSVRESSKASTWSVPTDLTSKYRIKCKMAFSAWSNKLTVNVTGSGFMEQCMPCFVIKDQMRIGCAGAKGKLKSAANEGRRKHRGEYRDLEELAWGRLQGSAPAETRPSWSAAAGVRCYFTPAWKYMSTSLRLEWPDTEGLRRNGLGGVPWCEAGVRASGCWAVRAERLPLGSKAFEDPGVQEEPDKSD